MEDTSWFTFQSIMLNIENHIKSPDDHLQALLKLFSMFKIKLYMVGTLITKHSRGCWNNAHQLWKKYWLLVRHSKDRKLHHSFCHKYDVPEYWFILNHSV